MSIGKRLSNMPAVLLIGIFCLAALIVYQLVIFLSRAFVYLGFNLFLLTDNLLNFDSVNPMVLWGILGLLTGSIVGVIIAVKKYKLSKLLILYPLFLTILFVVILSFVNHPAEVSGTFSPTEIDPSAGDKEQQNKAIYYLITQTIYVRSLPTLRSARLSSLSKGTRVEFIEDTRDLKNKSWFKISYVNPQTGYKQTGYVNAYYLALVR